MDAVTHRRWDFGRLTIMYWGHADFGRTVTHWRPWPRRCGAKVRLERHVSLTDRLSLTWLVREWPVDQCSHGYMEFVFDQDGLHAQCAACLMHMERVDPPSGLISENSKNLR